jgi:hypothetical protein
MPIKRAGAEPTDDAARALLDRCRCHVPFHVVRTRFLGATVSPVAGISAISMVKGLWGGEFPAFDHLDAVNELLAVLVMGLWNRLTRHQKRNEPFRLVRMTVPETTKGIAAITLMRREEIDGFFDGLFGAEESIELPERGHRALEELGEIRAMLAGAYELTNSVVKEASGEDVTQTLAHISQLTKIVEHELHEAVLSCARARRQMSHALPAARPVFH